MDSKSNSLGIDSLNALQNVKSTLKVKGVSSIECFKREDILFTPVVNGLTARMRTAGGERKRLLQLKRMETKAVSDKLDFEERKVMTKRAAHDMAAENARQQSEDHEATVAKRMKCVE
ncbi:hypothetical protein DPMN_073276 [Dreissena polymorpha]|uniref:Uncharacterized protein n=1 Tax=Dreissena polymorpha TaxID=45954 RepID=A0A9D4BYR9_DREPO|nr:hypothetical protein DPMN_073276 [Dreissena polymorpha]